MTSTAQACYNSSLAHAQSQVAKVLSHIRSLASQTTRQDSYASPFDPAPPNLHAWVGVEAAAQQAVALLGRARARLAALQSLEDARHR